eukprot:2348636-Pleurochrysis_carterae.AAC.2
MSLGPIERVDPMLPPTPCDAGRQIRPFLVRPRSDHLAFQTLLTKKPLEGDGGWGKLLARSLARWCRLRACVARRHDSYMTRSVGSYVREFFLRQFSQLVCVLR